jgi:hypothetical protein
MALDDVSRAPYNGAAATFVLAGEGINVATRSLVSRER